MLLPVPPTAVSDVNTPAAGDTLLELPPRTDSRALAWIERAASPFQEAVSNLILTEVELWKTTTRIDF